METERNRALSCYCFFVSGGMKDVSADEFNIHLLCINKQIIADGPWLEQHSRAKKVFFSSNNTEYFLSGEQQSGNSSWMEQNPRRAPVNSLKNGRAA